MSIAIGEAERLGEVLDHHGLDGVGRRHLRSSRPLVDTAWQLSTGADLDDPDVEGPRPPSWRLISSYVNRLLAVARHDATVANAFLSVNALVAAPSTLFRPGIVARVLAGPRIPSATAEELGPERRAPASS